jgi:signal transduction histidine kinase
MGAPRLTLTRLRFEETLEPRFRAHWYEHTLNFTRLAIVLAVVLYALFGILDALILPEVAGWIWLIRYGVFCPAALAVLALTYREGFRASMQPVLCGLAMLCGLGIVAMVAIADAEDGAVYYAGLLLVIPWAYTLLQLRFAYATTACLVVMAGYEVVAVWINPVALEIFLSNNFFFVSSVIISTLAGYTIERGMRTAFVQRRLIEEQRSRLAVRNEELDTALQATLDEVRVSRARIVAAADIERRKIERNLHDGAQQHLVALAVSLRLASDMVHDDPDTAARILDQLREDVKATIAEVRALAHGIYPPLLMESGLSVALGAAAERCPLDVSVQADVGRFTTEIEASIYFCVVEALQNAAKHAPRSSVRIRLWESDGALRFEVADDGPGFDPAAGGGAGHGFLNMSDRLGAIGGSVRWTSAPGAGVTVSGSVPLGSTAGSTGVDLRFAAASG